MTGAADQNVLEEYKQLRAELLQEKQERARTLLYCAITVFIFLPALTASAPIFTAWRDAVGIWRFPVAIATLDLAIYLHVQAAFSVCRISVHLKTIEGRLGLSWSSRNRTWRGAPKLVSSQYFRAAVVCYFIGALTLMIISYFNSQPRTPFDIIPICIGLVGVAMAILLARYDHIKQRIEQHWMVNSTA